MHHHHLVDFRGRARLAFLCLAMMIGALALA